jgi:hypothetical protein
VKEFKKIEKIIIKEYDIEFGGKNQMGSDGSKKGNIT